MNKLVLLLSFGFFTACSMGNRVVTSEAYSEVYMGMSEGTLKAKLGEPYATRVIDNHEKVLEYVEKVNAQSRVIETHHYIFVLREGQVTSKKMQFEANDVFDTRDAYDLQTSYNEPLVKPDPKQSITPP